MSSFVSLDYIEMLEDIYEDYAAECVQKGEEPKSRQVWYKTIYAAME